MKRSILLDIETDETGEYCLNECPGKRAVTFSFYECKLNGEEITVVRNEYYDIVGYNRTSYCKECEKKLKSLIALLDDCGYAFEKFCRLTEEDQP